MMIIYACPHCQTSSAKMRLSDERMEPTAEQRTAHPEHDLVGHEILVCKCGEPLTWYDLTPVTRYESFAEGMAAGITPDGALRLHEWAKQGAVAGRELASRVREVDGWLRIGTIAIDGNGKIMRVSDIDIN